MVIRTIVAIRVTKVIMGNTAIMAIKALIAMTISVNITSITAIVIIKGIIIITSNKAIHIYAAPIMANIAIIDITLITTIMAIVILNQL